MFRKVITMTPQSDMLQAPSMSSVYSLDYLQELQSKINSWLEIWSKEFPKLDDTLQNRVSRNQDASSQFKLVVNRLQLAITEVSKKFDILSSIYLSKGSTKSAQNEFIYFFLELIHLGILGFPLHGKASHNIIPSLCKLNTVLDCSNNSTFLRELSIFLAMIARVENNPVSVCDANLLEILSGIDKKQLTLSSISTFLHSINNQISSSITEIQEQSKLNPEEKLAKSTTTIRPTRPSPKYKPITQHTSVSTLSSLGEVFVDGAFSDGRLFAAVIVRESKLKKLFQVNSLKRFLTQQLNLNINYRLHNDFILQSNLYQQSLLLQAIVNKVPSFKESLGLFNTSGAFKAGKILKDYEVISSYDIHSFCTGEQFIETDFRVKRDFIIKESIKNKATEDIQPQIEELLLTDIATNYPAEGLISITDLLPIISDKNYNIYGLRLNVEEFRPTHAPNACACVFGGLLDV